MAHRSPDGTVTTTRAKRTDIPVQHLYRPIADWGHWDDLLTPPPALPEDPPPVPQEPRPASTAPGAGQISYAASAGSAVPTPWPSAASS